MVLRFGGAAEDDGVHEGSSAGRRDGVRPWSVMTEVAATRPPTLDELRARRDEILEIGARHGVFDIRVFGSVARGDAREGSDVDFLVDIEQDRSLFNLGAFYADLEDLLGCKVDVGTDVKPRLRERVLTEAVPL